MDKQVVMCIYNGILFSPKKERNPTICDNMDGPWGHYMKCQRKNKYSVVSLIQLLVFFFVLYDNTPSIFIIGSIIQP